MEITKLYEQMQPLFATFEENHTAAVEKKNSAAAKRARAALGEIKKLITPYRKASVTDLKRAKK